MKHKQYWTLTVGDYHNFDDAVACYKAAGIDAKFEEVGCSTEYEAVFWVGKKPSKYIEQRKQFYNKNYENS